MRLDYAATYVFCLFLFGIRTLLSIYIKKRIGSAFFYFSRLIVGEDEKSQALEIMLPLATFEVSHRKKKNTKT